MTGNDIILEDLAYIFGQTEKADRFAGKTIVITGCGGFIGFYLTHYFIYLKLQGVPVESLVLLDSFRYGRPIWLEELSRDVANIEIHNFDIAVDKLESIPAAHRADYVIHMASIASPTYYRQFPIETIDANVLGLKNLLEFYRHRPVESLLFFSSSEVYGDPVPECIPTAETYLGNVSTLGPRACYDESKRMGETMCYVYHQTYHMPIRIVRPFNNFGPGMAVGDKRVPADFAQAVLTNKDLVIHSDGKPTRTFCYIADAIAGYIKVLTHDEFDCFNIGMDRPEITVLQLASIFRNQAADLWGYSGAILYQPSMEKDYLTGNPSRRCPDISKARQLLDFQPVIDVEVGVRRYLSFLAKEREKVSS
ncbi:UDP-glucuronate decarboxylase [Paenibacillus sp. 1_12]|nr:UDP-glucuronate decarboxylase [Paenibacillus sp. 1_12]